MLSASHQAGLYIMSFKHAQAAMLQLISWQRALPAGSLQLITFTLASASGSYVALSPHGCSAAVGTLADSLLDDLDGSRPVACWGLLALGVVGLGEACSVDQAPGGRRAANRCQVSADSATA